MTSFPTLPTWSRSLMASTSQVVACTSSGKYHHVTSKQGTISESELNDISISIVLQIYFTKQKAATKGKGNFLKLKGKVPSQ